MSLPNWPSPFSPQFQTETGVPPTIAMVLLEPAEIAVAVPVNVARVGTRLLALSVPSPSWPALLSPHPQTEPSCRRITECALPTATETAGVVATLGRPLTATGVRRWVVVPSPSWPLELSPQARIVPSFISAMAWFVPADTARAGFAADGPITWTGVTLLVVVPLPSWP